MVNILTIALTHAIMLLAAWRIMLRDDLERDPEILLEPVKDSPQKPARKGRSRVRPRA
ncbi:MAG: hypothetical protein ABJP70_02275 [Erythrobacter sp.]